MKRFLGSGILLILFSIAIFQACKKPANDNNQPTYDKKAMLGWYADSLIIPGYYQLTSKATTLKTAVINFCDNPNTSTLEAARTAYRETHLQYVVIAPFQFGPAETALLDPFTNYTGGLDYDFNTAGQLTGFSIDTASIEANIRSGNYDLSVTTRNSFYSQGFPALNYLLFESNAMVAFTGTNASPRKQYLKAVADRLAGLFTTVTTDWTNYKASFVENTQTNVGSPIGNMVNQLAYQMDVLKGPRIGWPLGKQSGGVQFPVKVEGYYAGISTDLARASLASLKAVYLGNNNGKGLSGYLLSLGKGTLDNDIKSQFAAAATKLNAITLPMSQAIPTQTTAVDEAYREVQKLLTLLKTDLASATAVQITFMDNDGD